MACLPKAIGVVCCGFLLGLGVSTFAQIEVLEQMHKLESSQSTDDRIIQAEVLRFEGDDCVLKSQDGKEVRLHIDVTTLKAKNIEPGQHIEAKVDEQNHALSIFSVDRRNDKA